MTRGGTLFTRPRPSHNDWMSQTATTNPADRYADWKAPAEDGQMLIWPDPPQLLADTRDNARRLSGANQVLIQNLPLPDLRRRARQFIGHDGDEPLIATGHQTELFHPGVWAKNALIDAAAAKLGGKAYHFAVDSDAPKHLHVRWPGGSRPITDDPRLTTAEWSGLLHSPTPRHLQHLVERLDEAAAEWSFRPAYAPFFETMRRLALESRGLASDVSNAIHAVDWDLGLRYHELVTSPLWTSEPYLAFVHHILARAGAFAADYNAALADYRARNGIKTTARPMPDLIVRDDEVESPFWLDNEADETRERCTVVKSGNGFALTSPKGDRFEFDPAANGDDAAALLLAWCRRNAVRIAPRALTLTTFFRLFLADQFVHGIGGGRYDQVTDDVIQRHFGLEAPRFSVTTATLYFPAALSERRINLRPMLQEGRRIRHGSFSATKRDLVARIDSLPRLSRERRELFFQMHQRLAAESNGPAVQQWEQRFREARDQSQRQAALFDRELFFAIQPRERLRGMIERYGQAFR